MNLLEFKERIGQELNALASGSLSNTKMKRLGRLASGAKVDGYQLPSEDQELLFEEIFRIKKGEGRSCEGFPQENPTEADTTEVASPAAESTIDLNITAEGAEPVHVISAATEKPAAPQPEDEIKRVEPTPFSDAGEEAKISGAEGVSHVEPPVLPQGVADAADVVHIGPPAQEPSDTIPIDAKPSVPPATEPPVDFIHIEHDEPPPEIHVTIAVHDEPPIVIDPAETVPGKTLSIIPEPHVPQPVMDSVEHAADVQPTAAGSTKAPRVRRLPDRLFVSHVGPPDPKVDVASTPGYNATDSHVPLPGENVAEHVVHVEPLVTDAADAAHLKPSRALFSGPQSGGEFIRHKLQLIRTFDRNPHSVTAKLRQAEIIDLVDLKNGRATLNGEKATAGHVQLIERRLAAIERGRLSQAFSSWGDSHEAIAKGFQWIRSGEHTTYPAHVEVDLLDTHINLLENFAQGKIKINGKFAKDIKGSQITHITDEISRLKFGITPSAAAESGLWSEAVNGVKVAGEWLESLHPHGKWALVGASVTTVAACVGYLGYRMYKQNHNSPAAAMKLTTSLRTEEVLGEAVDRARKARAEREGEKREQKEAEQTRQAAAEQKRTAAIVQTRKPPPAGDRAHAPDPPVTSTAEQPIRRDPITIERKPVQVDNTTNTPVLTNKPKLIEAAHRVEVVGDTNGGSRDRSANRIHKIMMWEPQPKHPKTFTLDANILPSLPAPNQFPSTLFAIDEKKLPDDILHIPPLPVYSESDNKPIRLNLDLGINLANRGDGVPKSEAFQSSNKKDLKQWSDDRSGEKMTVVHIGAIKDTSIVTSEGWTRTTHSEHHKMLWSVIKDGQGNIISNMELDGHNQLVERAIPNSQKLAENTSSRNFGG